jgi:hypothetical protein
MAKIPLHPMHPERVCWGCDKYCPADSLLCGNGTVRTQHPVELLAKIGSIGRSTAHMLIPSHLPLMRA